MDRRSESRMWPLESCGDPRTPLAWQHRNLNYQQLQQRGYLERLAAGGTGSEGVGDHPQSKHKSQHGHQHVEDLQTQKYLHQQQQQQQAIAMRVGRPSSPSTQTSGKSSSSSSSRHNYDTSGMSAYQVGIPMAGGPMANTYDGEPCPVHHLSLMMPPPPSPHHSAHYATLAPPPSLPPPDKGMLMLLPPMMRPRPLVLPADPSAQPEPLPMRDPKATTPLPTKDTKVAKKDSSNNCRGYSVVLWLIITVITIGIILGAVLRFVMG